MIATNQPMVLSSQAMPEVNGVLSRHGVETLRNVRWSAADTSRLVTPASSSKGGRTAIIPVFGFMEQRQTLAGLVLGGVSTEMIGVEFMAAVNDPKVNRIILLFDTPGGSVYGVKELADLIYAARGTKDIIGVIAPMAASGGLWVASQCPVLVIQPSGDTGSLGVVAQHIDESGALEKEGIVVTTIRSSGSPYKQEGTSAEPLTADAKAYLQRRADDIFADFAGAVARGRGKSVGQVVETFGKGRLLSASEALRVGAVDHIATLSDVITKPEKISGRPRWSMSASAWQRQVSKRSAQLKSRAAGILAIAKAHEPPATLATISGLAIPYNVTGRPNPNETEIIKPGALSHLANSSADVRFDVDHEFDKTLGRRSDFTLRLEAAADGLRVEADIPDTIHGKQLLQAVQGKRFAGWSFTIDMPRSVFTETQLAGKTHRMFTKMAISSVSACVFPGKPAYAMREQPKLTLRTAKVKAKA